MRRERVLDRGMGEKERGLVRWAMMRERERERERDCEESEKEADILD